MFLCDHTGNNWIQTGKHQKEAKELSSEKIRTRSERRKKLKLVDKVGEGFTREKWEKWGEEQEREEMKKKEEKTKKGISEVVISTKGLSYSWFWRLCSHHIPVLEHQHHPPPKFPWIKFHRWSPPKSTVVWGTRDCRWCRLTKSEVIFLFSHQGVIHSIQFKKRT